VHVHFANNIQGSIQSARIIISHSRIYTNNSCSSIFLYSFFHYTPLFYSSSHRQFHAFYHLFGNFFVFNWQRMDLPKEFSNKICQFAQTSMQNIFYHATIEIHSSVMVKIWISSGGIWGSLLTAIPSSHLHRLIIPDDSISWWWALWCSKHVERWNK